MKSREVHLVSRPVGALALENFAVADVDVASPVDGGVLIKNLWMSIDAGQRTLMGSGDTDIADLPPKRFELNHPMEGQAIGQVIESRRADLPVGTLVVSNFGWREYFVFDGTEDGFTLTKLVNPVTPVQAHLHILSVYGLSAWHFVCDSAKVSPGETIWVTTAAGTTGSLACQIAKLAGCKVIGTTGSDRKVRWLQDELSLDAAFNYNEANLREAIKAACPEGIDVVIDFAGGTQLEAAIDLINPRGRIIKVGETASYDGSPIAGPDNLFQLVLKRVDFLGRSVFDLLPQAAAVAKVQAKLARWLAAGQIKMPETIYQGIGQAAQAQIDLFKGKNIGKVLVKLGEAEELG